MYVYLYYSSTHYDIDPSLGAGSHDGPIHHHPWTKSFSSFQITFRLARSTAKRFDMQGGCMNYKQMHRYMLIQCKYHVCIVLSPQNVLLLW